MAMVRELSFVRLGFILLGLGPKPWSVAVIQGIWDPKPRLRLNPKP